MRPRSRPQLFYDTFGDFCRDNGSNRSNPYPCLACKGQGWTRIEANQIELHTDYFDDDIDDDHLEIIDTTSRIICHCPKCGGTGRGTEEECQKAYSKILKDYQQNEAAYQKAVRRRKEALKKLTKDEKAALKELGV